MTNKIIAANWKMNFDVHESSLLVHELEKLLPTTKGVDVIIFAPATSLYALGKEVDPRKIRLGAQNVNQNDHGPFTGEISPHMVRDLVNYVLVGHSERRQLYGETDADVAKKAQAVINQKMTPVICIGENLQEKTNGETDSVIRHQLSTALSMLNKRDARELIIAYEPVWAISDGVTAKQVPSPGDVAHAASVIRQVFVEHFGKDADSEIRVIYGGSSNPDNAQELMSAEGCDGLLPGGASLKADSLASMINTAIKMGGA